MKLRLTRHSTWPLLMHMLPLASPLNPHAERPKALTANRVKTDRHRPEIAQMEIEYGFQRTAGIGPFSPTAMLRRSLADGARLIRAGNSTSPDTRTPTLADVAPTL